MKKITFALAFIILCTSVLFYGCKKNDNLIRVNEVTHSVFYAPLYIAINNGYFADEGLEIELTNGGGADQSMTALVSNNADIGLMGPEATIYVVKNGKQDAPVVFAQLTKRDGSFLIGRNEEPNFKWENTIGKEIIGGRKGGVPAMTLQYLLEEIKGLKIGTDSTSVNLNTGVAFNLVASAFEGGQGDYCTMFEPSASEYVKAGKGYIVASIGADSGEVPYTAFTATKSYMSKNPDKIEKFIRAVYRGYKYLISATSEEVAEVILPSFNGSSKESLVTAINSYKSIDAWVSSPVMKEEAYNNLINIMINAGELDKKVDFDKVVDCSIAKKVLKELS